MTLAAPSSVTPWLGVLAWLLLATAEPEKSCTAASRVSDSEVNFRLLSSASMVCQYKKVVPHV